jgi:oligopeptidase B
MIENIQPPIAKIIPTELKKFGDVRVDNYFG